MGNVVKFTQSADTTVSFANTGTSNIVTFIRTKSETFSTGGVEFDGTGDYLGTTSSSSDLSMGTGDFTIEMWVKYNSISNEGLFQISTTSGGLSVASSLSLNVNSQDGGKYSVYFNNSQNGTSAPGTCNNKAINMGQWYHLALTRSGTTSRFYVDGVCQVFGTDCTNDSFKSDSTDYNGTYVCIGGNYDTSFLLDGTISNFRIIKGTALYTGLDSFDPPLRELTNVTNTKFLACQSDSSTTAATVIPSGTITAYGNPTAGAETIGPLLSPFETTITWPSAIKWDGGSAPTLVPINVGGEEYNQITLLTRDEGVTWYGWESGSISRKTGLLYMWGQNDKGQLGQNSVVKYSSPVQIPGGWNEIITGNDSQSGVAGTKTDGTLWAWGNNYQGEIGNNSNTQYSSPVQIPGTTWWASDDKNQDGTAINGGMGIKRIIKSDGTLWQWGYNGYGILATGDTVSHSSPVQVPGTTWKAISGNSICCCATKTDGTLWAWGHNEFGALGMSNLTDYNSPVQVPGTTWDRPVLGAGQFSNGAFKTDGTLWTWGRNETGMLGLNNQTNYSSPKQIPGTTWRSCCMAAGQSGMIATKTDGTLWTWGTSGAGQLGLNDGSQYSSPKQVPGSWSDQVYMQGYVSMAIKTDGTLWSWGQGTNGRLGINNTTSYSSPKQIGSNTNWIRVGLGGDNWSGAIAEI